MAQAGRAPSETISDILFSFQKSLFKKERDLSRTDYVHRIEPMIGGSRSYYLSRFLPGLKKGQFFIY